MRLPPPLIRRKFHWISLSALTLMFSLSMVAFEVSRSSERVNVVLTPGTDVSVRLFRLFPTPLQFTLYFSRHGADNKRPELGEAWHRDDYKERRYLEYREPGEPVKLRVSSLAGMDVGFEALPKTSYNTTHIGRALVPDDDDGLPERFAWPQRLVTLPGGWTQLQVSVVNVGPSLVGETVELIIQPPLGFKGAARGYGWLWWFFFWPVFAAMLAIYFGVLCWLGFRTRHK